MIARIATGLLVPGALAAQAVVGPPVSMRRAPQPAAYQSTSGLGQVERPVRLEVAVGADLLVGGDESYGHRMRMGLVSVRWQLDEPIAFRLWASASRVTDPAPAPSRDYVAVGVASDIPIRMGKHATLAPSVGIGRSLVRPVVYGFRDEALALLFGLSFRYGFLVVEQHFAVLGGDLYKPTTLGARF